MTPTVYKQHVTWARLHDEAEAKLWNLCWQSAQANPDMIMQV